MFGPSDGERKFGGSPAGPLWSSETPFACGITPYGLGLGGANVADLASASTPSLGQAVSFDVSGFAGDGVAFLALAGGAASLPLFGGTLLVALAPSAVTTLTLAAGAGAAGAPPPSSS